MKKKLLLILSLVWSAMTYAQDTTVVQTLTFDSTGRSYDFDFPDDSTKSYEKILMMYTMRCKEGLVSNGQERNKGCGEWDYSCNTYITDPNHVDSIKASGPSHTISNFSGTTYQYHKAPLYDYYQYTEKHVSYSDTTSHNIYTVGSGSTSVGHPFGVSNTSSKTQYLLTATELTNAGASGGNITGLSIDALSGGDVEALRISIKNTSKTALDAGNPDLGGFTQCYFKATSVQTGVNNLSFYQNFNWDGTSNIIVEISYTNKQSGTDIMLNGVDVGSGVAINALTDGYFELNGQTHLNMGRDAMVSGTNTRTIEMWAKVDVFNGAGIFQAGSPGSTGADFSLRTTGADDEWRAQLWGPPDFDLTLNGSKGSWHHYAMTFDGTTTYVYYDGVLAASNTEDMSTVMNDLLVGNWYGTRMVGLVEDLRVWNTDLSESTINDWKNRKVDASHPNYANLLGDYGMDGNLDDESPNMNTVGVVYGNPQWHDRNGKDLYKNFVNSTMRPNIGIIQGVYTTVVQDSAVVDSVQKQSDQIIYYVLDGTDRIIEDTLFGWSDSTESTYNATGGLLSTSNVVYDSSITVSTLDYMAKYDSKFEIMSFVTPYGIGLDFGMEGKTWVFDVSDFAPILKGTRRMSMERGGQFQEQMDIQFLFIEGTPPREVIDIQQVWRVESRNYQQIQNESYYEPRDIPVDPQAELFKTRVAISGHGQEGEFIRRIHYVNIDGGNNELEWQVWRECSNNPIYPQGGTWIYDRAGWCPGEPTEMQEYWFTTTNSSVNLDYGVTTGSGDSRYIVNTQLVSYGAPNFTNDAAITLVKRPSNLPEYGRVNPVCFDPLVQIKNTGSADLTSLTFTYSVSGGPVETYEWTGSLGTMLTEDVTLPISGGEFWVGDDINIFTVEISSPNGVEDEYANNNIYRSEFDFPDQYEERFVIELNTNNRYSENRYELRDANGNNVFTKFYTSGGSIKDTLTLGEGCYEMIFHDTGEDGLYFWNNPLQTQGFLVFKDMNDLPLKVFENDFGMFLNYTFVIGEFVNVEEPNNHPRISIFPNPTTGLVNINMDLLHDADASITVTNGVGQIVKEEKLHKFNRGNKVIDLTNEAKGIYNVVVRTGNWVETKRIVVE